MFVVGRADTLNFVYTKDYTTYSASWMRVNARWQSLVSAVAQCRFLLPAVARLCLPDRQPHGPGVGWMNASIAELRSILFWLRSLSRASCCQRELSWTWRDKKCYRFRRCSGLAHSCHMATALVTCSMLPLRCQPLLCVGRRLLRLPSSFQRRNVLVWCCQTRMLLFYQQRWATPSVPALTRWRCCLSNVLRFRSLNWYQPPAVCILQPIR